MIGQHAGEVQMGAREAGLDPDRRLEEGNYAPPELRYIPAIIEFLGYNPLPPATNCGERLVRHRMTLGMTQSDAARRIGVDPSTLARWERGEREPEGALAKRVERFLDEPDSVALMRRAG